MKQILKALQILLLVTLSVASQAAVESTTYILTDHLGSPILATDENGNTLWQEDYLPYGKQLTNEDGDNSVGFTGHKDDKALGVTYMQGRWYHQDMGRFLSIDPVGFVEENPISFNRYTYVNNNPYKYTDPDGRYLSNEQLNDYAGMNSMTEGGGRGSYVGAGGVYDTEGAQLYVAAQLILGVSKFLPGGKSFVPPSAPKPSSESASRAGSIRNVNPTNGTNNCVNCSIATDATLAGRPASALSGSATSISVLEKHFGARFGSATTISAIENSMLNAGKGARGIVFGSRGNQTGHVFNVANQNGKIRFLDGQTGKAATFEGFESFHLLRTN